MRTYVVRQVGLPMGPPIVVENCSLPGDAVAHAASCQVAEVGAHIQATRGTGEGTNLWGEHVRDPMISARYAPHDGTGRTWEVTLGRQP